MAGDFLRKNVCAARRTFHCHYIKSTIVSLVGEGKQRRKQGRTRIKMRGEGKRREERDGRCYCSL
jgi:hypothetical protein